MEANMLNVVILLVCYCTVFCNAQSKWKNPHEMVKDVDEVTVDKRVPDGQCASECVDVKRRMVDCEQKLSIQNNAKQELLASNVVQHFKNFIRNLSDKFCFLKLNEDMKYQIRFKFTQDQCKNLNAFVFAPSYESKALMEIQEILENFIKTTEQVSDVQFLSRMDLFTAFCIEHFHVIFTVTLVLAVSVNAVWVFNRVAITKRLVFTFLVILFIISVPWNWWHMYKKREASKMATMAKAGSSDPCSGRSYWKKFASLFSFQTDDCVMHAEAANIHAAIEVTPLMAVSVTISRVILEPLEYLGSSINKLISSSIEGLPLFMQITISVLVFCLAILSLFLIFGYNFRTMFFTIGPGRRQYEIEDFRRHRRELENKILELENKLNKQRDSINLSGGGDSLPSPTLSELQMSPTSIDSSSSELCPSPPEGGLSSAEST